jgi:hypothetical protein
MLLFIAQAADARMYQWLDPATGTTQFSGKPPSWYRSGADGPRVFVFDNGQLIDDTAIEVTDNQREALRLDAIATADAEEQAAILERERKLEALRAVMEPAPEPFEADVSLPSEVTATQSAAPAAGASDAAAVQGADEETMKQLKEIVEAFERSRTEQARSVLESQTRDRY